MRVTMEMKTIIDIKAMSLNLMRRFRKLIPDSRDKVIHVENSEYVIFKEEYRLVHYWSSKMSH